MEKEFVPYKLAVKLKELGFDEDCFGWYHVNDLREGVYFCYFNAPKRIKGVSDTLAPTFSQAFRWFRENYNIQSSVKFSGSKIHYVFEIRFQKLANGENPPIMVWHHLDSWLELDLDLFSTYEEAELACLTMLIEIVESKSE